MDRAEKFVNWLNEQEERLDWTDYRLAKEANIHQTIISRLRNQNIVPGWDTCMSIAAALHVSPITVFRKAGLLPEGPENEALLEDWLTLLSEMSPEDQEELRQIARLKLEREQKERTVKKLTPRRSKS